MRDAFGGVFTMNFLLVFIFIFVAFTAVSLNYAKAFKIKNAIIDYVEQNELPDLTNNTMADKLDELDTIVEKMDYNIACSDIGLTDGEIKEDKKVVGYCHKGIVIFQKETENIKSINNETGRNVTVARKITYQVSTRAYWNLGALNKILALGGKKEDSEDVVDGIWTINGEANVVIHN